MRRRERETRRGATAGFTLVELLVVVVIIGIIIALVLVASADGVRRAQERATQGLILKLAEGINDRFDALMNITAPVNPTHRFLAAVCYRDPTSGSNLPVGGFSTTAINSSGRRAQVIAQFDYIRAEMPDVFFLNANTADGAAVAANYPLNFAGRAYTTPSDGNIVTAYDPYLLPLGNRAPGLPYLNVSTLALTTNPLPSPPYPALTYSPPHSGIFGASFSAIGGITKNLGYGPKGYDGIDNDGDSMIDEMDEGVPAGSTLAALSTQVTTQLASHTHNTARAEMLYAVLVEGAGPLGSVFNRDEFTAKEVQDTDGDGLPEFVDAWGQPLQFYRWPIYYGIVPGSSDSQRGSNSYTSFGDVRDLDPLDTNQLLVTPGWWADNGTINHGLPSNSSGVNPSFSAPNGASGSVSQGALAFMNYFHLLVDPTPDSASTPTGIGWDRTGQYARRSYFSRALILSGGPDQEPGVAQFGRGYASLTGNSSAGSAAFPVATQSMDANASQLIFIENQAAQSDPYARTGAFLHIPDASDATTVFLQTNAGQDDISNHNLAAPGTGVR